MKRVLCKKFRLCLIIFALFGGAVFFPGAAGMAEAAGEKEVEIYSDFVTHYVWRGFLLTDDPVWQPGGTLSMYGFSFDVWFNVDLTSVNRPEYDYRLSEVDYTLSYEKEVISGLSLEAGAIHYTFPGTGDSATTELFVSAGYDVLTQPSLTVYRDVDESEGWYASFGIGHGFPLAEALNLGVGGAVGWGDSSNNRAYFGESTNAFTDVLVSVELDYQLSDNLGFSLFAGYTDILDSDLRDSVDSTDNLYGGVGAVFTF